MSDTKCILLRKQLMVSEKGRVAPCCDFLRSIPLETYEEETRKYAEVMDNGIRLGECQRCWDAEDRGLTSVRQSANQSARHFEGEGITSLDIRIHNKCNLACNMCHPDFSTLWGKLRNTNDVRYIPQTSLDKVSELSKNVRKISLQGGEPFFGDEYVNFVDGLENKSQIELDTFTNVVTANISAIERWSKELKSLRINASVDGIGESFEKIRWPAKWNKFERNARKIYDILGKDIMFFYTIQAANITSILPFIEWRDAVVPESKIVFTAVYHNDEITYKGLTSDERDLFLSQKESILSRLTFDPSLDEFDNREYNDIVSVYKLVEDMEIDNSLIKKREEFDSHTETLRRNHIG